MNNVREIEKLNQRELDEVIPPEASWHTDYRDTAYIYIGGLPFDLSEGDVITIFSQFGEAVHINLVRDKETGKSKGFAFLKYEDQRSTDLAVDNLGGATILGRVLRVDHTRYKRKDDEDLGDNTEIQQVEGSENSEDDDGQDRKRRRRSNDSQSDQEKRPMLKEERELADLLRNQDDDDPMKEYLIKEKREEVAEAIAEWKANELRMKKRESTSKHHRHRHYRSRKNGDGEGGHRSRRSRRSRTRSYSRDRDDESRRIDRHHQSDRRRRNS